MNKCVEPLQKQTMGVAFFSQNSQLLTFSLPIRNIFMYTAEIGLWQIFQFSIFVLSHEKYHYPSQRPNFRYFFSYFVLLPLSRIFWVTSSVRNTNCSLFFFSSHNSRKSRQATLDWEQSTLCHSFINLTQLIGDIKHITGQEIVLNHRSLYNSFSP